ncbi:haloacid dehalogenase-like hydrolase [Heyndrickxia ginsengihumi]|uniref:haloacid dehalogenase-like hydrolase n=1 Tax=Heyndrickxia ginsengihumi TaxID=363870 RepID=UPI00203DC38A|nr:haloacid dehalogenase-like hydrolase [Heyndrickxia ginsengihumi]MCM3023153.1 haloacid dehalogenase-like hydrolase [Heyndrickxia ginsengihumi]
MINMKKKCIVVDLDQTFIKGNTFHLWLKFLIFQSSFSNLWLTINIVIFVFFRLIRIISHEKLKRKIIYLSNLQKSKINLDEFINVTDKLINEDILIKLQNRTQNEIWILATAAPAIYSELIASKYNFDYCISTSMNFDSEWKENIRNVKLENVQSLVNKLNITSIDYLYTDHYDDIPLMRVAKKTYLVNPTIKTLENVKKYNINYSVINY